MKFYLLACLLLFTVFSSFLLLDSHPDPKTGKAGTAKIAFKSTDGGQTWQDISKGLPENLLEDSIQRISFFSNDKGLFLKVPDGLYHSTQNSTAPFWTKEIYPEEHSSIDSSKSGIFAYKWGVNLIKMNGTSVWSPIFENDQVPRIRTTFETVGGTIFLGTDKGYFKTADDGKTWKLVHAGYLVGNLAESNNVLLATSNRKIIRSTDNGENWEVVSGEGYLAFDVKPIKGGFAAITSSSETNPRTLMTSYDGGKTWQPTDAGLQDKDFINSIFRTWNDRPNVNLKRFGTSVIQVGENLLCAHRDGIFRSTDKGKTWKLLLPSVNDKVLFNLFISDNVIYAIPTKGGC